MGVVVNRERLHPWDAPLVPPGSLYPPNGPERFQVDNFADPDGILYVQGDGNHGDVDILLYVQYADPAPARTIRLGSSEAGIQAMRASADGFYFFAFFNNTAGDRFPQIWQYKKRA